MKHLVAAFCLVLAAAPAAVQGAAHPDRATTRALWTITHDPPRDAAHPARNRQLLIESHGAQMNALFFLAAGAGPHPTMLLLHGLPGNERNLDLAQAARRAGWNVLTFTYRGAWGSEGDFSISNAVEDTAAAMAFLRSSDAVREYGIDPARLVIAGHSMGGYMAAAIAAHDALGFNPASLRSRAGASDSPAHAHPPLAGLILLDAWNIAADAVQVRAAGAQGRARLIAGFDDFGRALHGATPESVADDVIAQGPGWSLPRLAPQLAHTPVLTITAFHGGGAENRVTTEALRRAGARVTALEIDSDHPFSDHRIALAAEVVRWLQGLVSRR
jgi:pimeloyl-ACP methyl ester carboxylesterase